MQHNKVIVSFIEKLIERVRLDPDFPANEVHVFNVHAAYGHYQVIIGPAPKNHGHSLEISGVMPSWAVPKGPTLDPTVRRLAMPTGDHDLEYRHFEGVIPAGEYGGGPVMIWDEGTYTPEKEVSKGVREEAGSKEQAKELAARSYSEGNLKFRLYGKKLEGSFALVRTRGFAGKESWLLIKHRDEHAKAGYDPNDFDVSAASGRSIAEILAAAGSGQNRKPRRK